MHKHCNLHTPDIISPSRSAPSALRGADEVYRTRPTSRIPQRPPAARLYGNGEPPRILSYIKPCVNKLNTALHWCISIGTRTSCIKAVSVQLYSVVSLPNNKNTDGWLFWHTARKRQSLMPYCFCHEKRRIVLNIAFLFKYSILPKQMSVQSSIIRWGESNECKPGFSNHTHRTFSYFDFCTVQMVYSHPKPNPYRKCFL